ncbi:MAG: methionyl-tRNA formyltransferase [Dehalococcoidia bacterium]|nr:methionyl-tRNA formyltransferase [Dehalococcoidia bacterium]
MRIVLTGQAAFGAKVLQSLLDRKENIVAVFLPPDKPGARLDPLKDLAQRTGVPVYQPHHMRDPGVYDKFAELSADLAIMAFVTDIVPERILKAPRLGTIQYHPSLLPRHRGGSAINWAIIHGDAATGITIFWPDGGIDTGPILLQKQTDILPDDTVGTLYFERLFPMGVEALMESLDLICQDKAPKIPQDESNATYEGLCREEDGIISWDAPGSVVYRLVRGTNPQPGATTSFRGRTFKVFDSSLHEEESSGIPGEVLEVGKQGVLVACKQGSLAIRRVQPQGQPKMGAAEFAGKESMTAGDRLG